MGVDTQVGVLKIQGYRPHDAGDLVRNGHTVQSPCVTESVSRSSILNRLIQAQQVTPIEALPHLNFLITSMRP